MSRRPSDPPPRSEGENNPFLISPHRTPRIFSVLGSRNQDDLEAEGSARAAKVCLVKNPVFGTSPGC